MELSRSQQKAIENITKYATSFKHDARAVMNHILAISNISEGTFENAVSNLKFNARIGLHFHPDRPDFTLKSVAQSLFKQGIYKSQFETGISNGSVSAYPGGERDLWENKMFGGAYHQEGTSNTHRPKYGALNVMLHSDGPSPRFGSCYFLLSPKVSLRSTFTYMDSHQNPKEKGTFEEFDMILAALLEDTLKNSSALGEKNLTPTRLIHHLLNFKSSFIDFTNKEPSRNLDHYIEAQIHGDISLREDVEVLVADPSFKGTNVGNTLEQLCLKYSIELYWHRGFILNVEEVPSNFRGPAMPSLAKRIAQNNSIDARVIGSAVQDVYRNPQNWVDRGIVKEVLQELKLLWHVLVRFGK